MRRRARNFIVLIGSSLNPFGVESITTAANTDGTTTISYRAPARRAKVTAQVEFEISANELSAFIESNLDRCHEENSSCVLDAESGVQVLKLRGGEFARQLILGSGAVPGWHKSGLSKMKQWSLESIPDGVDSSVNGLKAMLEETLSIQKDLKELESLRRVTGSERQRTGVVDESVRTSSTEKSDAKWKELNESLFKYEWFKEGMGNVTDLRHHDGDIWVSASMSESNKELSISQSLEFVKADGEDVSVHVKTIALEPKRSSDFKKLLEKSYARKLKTAKGPVDMREAELLNVANQICRQDQRRHPPRRKGKIGKAISANLDLYAKLNPKITMSDIESTWKLLESTEKSAAGRRCLVLMHSCWESFSSETSAGKTAVFIGLVNKNEWENLDPTSKNPRINLMKSMNIYFPLRAFHRVLCLIRPSGKSSTRPAKTKRFAATPAPSHLPLFKPSTRAATDAQHSAPPC